MPLSAAVVYRLILQIYKISSEICGPSPKNPVALVHQNMDVNSDNFAT